MTLTIQVEQQADSTWKATFVEMPKVFYVGASEAEVRGRIRRLAHALRSPHIKIERVLSDGDVILTISREDLGEKEVVRKTNGVMHQMAMTAHDAVLLFLA